MKIKISGKTLILFQLQFLFVIKLITTIFPVLETFTNYVSDIIVMVIFYYATRFPKIKSSQLRWLKAIILFLLIFDILMFFLRGQGFLIFLWGMRNQYRFIMFTLLASIVLTSEDLKDVERIILRWFIINIPVITIEFLMGYKMDYLGGTFGIENGCNAIVNIFLCVVVSIAVVSWLNKRKSTAQMLFYVIFSLYWAALSELKMFYIEFVVIIALALLLVKSNKIRKISVIAIASVAGIIAINLLITIFPYYADFFNLESVYNYATNVNLGVGGFGRVTAISRITSWFFNSDTGYTIFGMGTGSGEFSSISFLNSQIYLRFKEYQYFSYFHAFVFVERGYFGLLWYIAFFVSSILIAMKRLKKSNRYDITFLQISVISSVCSVITMVYDIGLRTSTSAYLAFLLCAIPYIICKKKS